MSLLSIITNTESFRGAFFQNSSEPENTIAYVHSLEGDIYLLEVESSEGLSWIQSDSEAKPRRFDSLANAKRFARDLGFEHIQMAFRSPYEEMIGL